MDFPRQPGSVKITIKADHGDDVYRAFLMIKRVLDNHYASTNSYIRDGQQIIDCYPFAVND